MFIRFAVSIILFTGLGSYVSTPTMLTQRMVDEAGTQLVIEKKYSLGGKAVACF